MIMRRIHLVLGLTFGTILAISGLTGATLSFNQEILNALDNKQCGDHSMPNGIQDMLATAQQQLGEGMLLTARVDLGCELEVQTTDHKTYYLQEATHSLVAQNTIIPILKSFFHSIKDIHEGHWFPPSNPLSMIVWKSFGISAFMLFFIIPIGVYLRWPRNGQHSVSFWFKINTAAKGIALLKRTHLVFGAIFAVTLLISAHTGAFQAVSTSWYANAVKGLFGDDTQKPKFRPPPPPKANIELVSVDDLTPLLDLLNQQNYQSAAIEFEVPAKIIFTGESGANLISMDQESSQVTLKPFGDEDKGGHWLSAYNQELHEGKLFGLPGRIFMTISALSLPFFYVSGIIFFIKRHRKQKR